MRLTRRPALISAIASLGLVVGIAVAAPASADPARIVSGWIPYWMASQSRPVGVNSAVANANLFSEVSPFWFSATPNASGGVKVGFNPNFTNGAANAAWATSTLKAAGIPVIPSVADGAGKGVMAKTLADPAARAAHVADIVGLVTANGYDGIDLDYEVFAFLDGRSSWDGTSPNWVAFVNELANALHAQGKKLFVTIPPPCDTTNACGGTNGYWVYALPSIAAAADRVRIMAYDYHVSGAGAIAPINWVTAIVQHAISVAPAAKIQIGVPTYGRSWTKKVNGSYQISGDCPSAGSSSYDSVVAKASVSDADIPGILATNNVPATAVQWDPVNGENVVEYDKATPWGSGHTCTVHRVMWFDGPQGVLLRTQLVSQYGLAGAAYWTVGGEDPAQWPMIRDYANSLGTPVPAPTPTPDATTPPVPAPTVSTVNLDLTPRAARVHSVVRINVTANPARPGQSIVLQRMIGSTWKRAASASASDQGTAVLSLRIKSRNRGQYRVVAVGDDTVLSGASRTFAIKGR